MNSPVDQPMNSPVDQPVNRPVDQQVDQPENPLVNRPVDQPENQFRSQPHSQSDSHSRWPVRWPVDGRSDSQPEHAYDPELAERVFIMNRTDDYLNRWRFSEHNDLVNYDTERFVPDYVMSGNHLIRELIAHDLHKTYQNVRRVKVFGLSATFWNTKQVLDSLAMFTALEQLEIDQLVLESNRIIEYKFGNLKTLSIDALKIVDAQGKETENGMSLLWLNAPLLHSLYLGGNSIFHILFKFQDSVKTLVCDEDRGSYARQFRKLRHFECNRVGFHRLSAILEVIEKSDLLTLSLNLDNFASASVSLQPEQLKLIMTLHKLLSESAIVKRRISSGLRIFLQGVEVDLKQPFTAFVMRECCDSLVRSILEYHHRNFDRLDRWNSVTSIDYLELFVSEENRFLLIEFDELFDGEVVRVDSSPLPRHYPNLRSVRVCNRPQLQVIGSEGGAFHKIDSKLFIGFLNSCRGLTELRLENTRFEQDVYDQLGELELAQCLRKLTIFENFEQFPNKLSTIAGYESYRPIEPLQFGFLRKMPYLRLFRTNVACRETMMAAVRGMQPEDEFQFRFLNGAGGGSNQLTFVNAARSYLLKLGYALTAELFYTDDINPPLKTLSRKSLDSLFAIFETPENLHVTRFAWRLAGGGVQRLVGRRASRAAPVG